MIDSRDYSIVLYETHKPQQYGIILRKSEIFTIVRMPESSKSFSSFNFFSDLEETWPGQKENNDKDSKDLAEELLDDSNLLEEEESGITVAALMTAYCVIDISSTSGRVGTPPFPLPMEIPLSIPFPVPPPRFPFHSPPPPLLPPPPVFRPPPPNDCCESSQETASDPGKTVRCVLYLPINILEARAHCFPFWFRSLHSVRMTFPSAFGFFIGVTSRIIWRYEGNENSPCSQVCYLLSLRQRAKMLGLWSEFDIRWLYSPLLWPDRPPPPLPRLGRRRFSAFPGPSEH
uniref:Uncharacterized protein n=1 Tax=Romanomermis culicivorax TaxID=13658 RepID=A0A915K8G4_ROMCU